MTSLENKSPWQERGRKAARVVGGWVGSFGSGSDLGNQKLERVAMGSNYWGKNAHWSSGNSSHRQGGTANTTYQSSLYHVH